MIDQRKNQRFELHLPVQILHPGVDPASHTAQTHNISSSGVLFVSDADVPLGRVIEYIVTLAHMPGVQVDLRCIGRVLRLQKSPETVPPANLIAATLDRYEFVRRHPQ